MKKLWKATSMFYQLGFDLFINFSDTEHWINSLMLQASSPSTWKQVCTCVTLSVSHSIQKATSMLITKCSMKQFVCSLNRTHVIHTLYQVLGVLELLASCLIFGKYFPNEKGSLGSKVSMLERDKGLWAVQPQPSFSGVFLQGCHS